MFIWDLKDNEKTSFKKISVFDIALGEKEKNIDTRDAFVPINKQKILIDKYKLFEENDCPNANYIMENGFYLPSGNTIINEDIDFVCNEIKNIAKK